MRSRQKASISCGPTSAAPARRSSSAYPSRNGSCARSASTVSNEAAASRNILCTAAKKYRRKCSAARGETVGGGGWAMRVAPSAEVEEKVAPRRRHPARVAIQPRDPDRERQRGQRQLDVDAQVGDAHARRVTEQQRRVVAAEGAGEARAQVRQQARETSHETRRGNGRGDRGAHQRARQPERVALGDRVG